MSDWDNEAIAAKLREMADLLEQQQANPFRVGAYRRAARTVSGHAKSVRDVAFEQGPAGLDDLPGIGRGIALAIEELIHTGRWRQLERLQGELDAEQTFQSVPGIGPELARRIHSALEVDSLAELETAAHDGRLQQVPGIGPRRTRMIAAALAQMLQRRPARLHNQETTEPPIDLLLEVDREYRDKAAAGKLRKIAPRRFNPDGNAWLPILHTQRDDWHFTALYSNTARAHELGKTDDWVVIYFHTDQAGECQRTIVTETRGRLAGQRVVRGREAECLSLADR